VVLGAQTIYSSEVWKKGISAGDAQLMMTDFQKTYFLFTKTTGCILRHTKTYYIINNYTYFQLTFFVASVPRKNFKCTIKLR
jgi:hypothetical protein